MLELNDVTKTFGGIKAVSGFSMKAHPGEILGLIGPNGAGKTTMFNLITGVYKPDGGTISFDGENIGGMAPHHVVEKGIARTFQNIRLFNKLTVLDNVKIAFHNKLHYQLPSAVLGLPLVGRQNKEIIKEAMTYLELVGLQDHAKRVAGSLPYGLSRRLEIARALALKPKLILLDEPAAGMNPEEIVDLKELICMVHREFALMIVLIEHRMDLIMSICPRIVVLNFGTKLTEGTPEELQNNEEVLKAYLGEDYKNA